MTGDRIGIWLIGAWGRIGTALAAMLPGLQARTISTRGLVTEQPEFGHLDLADWSRFVIGGHEIRKTSTVVEARNLFAGSKIVTPEQLAQWTPAMTEWDRNVRTGTLLNAGRAVEARASTASLKTRGERPSAAVRRIAVDLEEFRAAASLEHLIVVNVASVEPPIATGDDMSCDQLLELLEHRDLSPVTTSVLYAVAALQSGCSYLNWTQSIGPSLPAMNELSRRTATLVMGREGRDELIATGLVFAVSDDERLRSASALLDVVRLCDREKRRGCCGLMAFLSCFFKQPLGNPPADIAAQRALLYDWMREVASAG